MTENVQKTVPPRNIRPGAKFNETQVAEIRELYALGSSTRQLARRFGVAQSTIVYVIGHNTKRPTWTNVARTTAESEAFLVSACQMPEKSEGIDTGTGRIEGPDGTIYATIRAACVATGLEREEIARQLNDVIFDGSARWRYQKGIPPALVIPAFGGDWGAPQGVSLRLENLSLRVRRSVSQSNKVVDANTKLHQDPADRKPQGRPGDYPSGSGFREGDDDLARALLARFGAEVEGDQE